jgi:hypothetical protein
MQLQTRKSVSVQSALCSAIVQLTHVQRESAYEQVKKYNKISYIFCHRGLASRKQFGGAHLTHGEKKSARHLINQCFGSAYII